jgi:hypothetical protein
MDSQRDSNSKRLAQFINRNPYMVFRHIVANNSTYKLIEDNDQNRCLEISKQLSFVKNFSTFVGSALGGFIGYRLAPRGSHLGTIVFFTSISLGAYLFGNIGERKFDTHYQQLDRIMEKYAGWNHNPEILKHLAKDFGRYL